jgi:hypothetical protein
LVRFGVAALALVLGFVGLQGSSGWYTPLRKSGWSLGEANGGLDQGETDDIELGIAPDRGFRRQISQAVHQPISGGVDQQPELIGGRRGARRSVGVEMHLMHLGTIWKLSQNSLIIAAIMLISTVWPGKFSS